MWAVLQYAVQDQRNELERLADTVAITVADDVYDAEPIENLDRHGAVEVAVYDEDGHWDGWFPVGSDGPALSRALKGGVRTGTENGRLVVAVPVTHGAT